MPIRKTPSHYPRLDGTDLPRYKEKNLEDPSTEEKINDLKTFIESSKFGMMTTHSSQSNVLASRCMAIAGTVGSTFGLQQMELTIKQEAGGIDLIFHTNTESGKTDDLDKDAAANMSFYNSTGEWASLSGNAEIITDRSVVSKYYSPSLKAWLGDLGDGKHDGSENDPRIGIIKIKTKTATYAISRANPISRGIEVSRLCRIYTR